MDDLLKLVDKAIINQKRKNHRFTIMEKNNEEGIEKLKILNRYKRKIYRKIHNYKKLSPTEHAEWVSQNSKFNPNTIVYWNGKTSYQLEMP
jgi:hypothetical protein